MMKAEDVIATLKHIADSDQKCATDVVYALALLSTNVGNMLTSVKTEMHESIEAGNYDVAELSAFCKNIETLDEQIELCMSSLIQQSPNAKIAAEKEPVLNKETVDYSKYQVDRKEVHRIDEDFTNKKICAILFNGKLYSVEAWRDALLILASELNKINPTLFRTFLTDEDFIGQSRSYFVTYHEPYKSVLVPGTNIYAWVNLNTKMMCTVMKRMLVKYGYNPDDLEIYLRADYSDLH